VKRAETAGFTTLGLTIDYIKTYPSPATPSTPSGDKNKAKLVGFLVVVARSIDWLHDPANRKPSTSSSPSPASTTSTSPTTSSTR